MPMSALLNIAVAEPSAIIRSGLEAVSVSYTHLTLPTILLV